jgi:hypothetical protein
MPVGAEVLFDAFPDELSNLLRRCDVFLIAELFENTFLVRVDHKCNACGVVFHENSFVLNNIK